MHITTLDWSTALQQIMRAHSQAYGSNPRPSGRPAGHIWKSILVASILADLEGEEDATQTIRLIRIDHSGLCGVIFYRVPTHQGSTRSDETTDSAIDALIDRSAPRVFYFCNFSCTSFLVGQVMKSHLLHKPTISPTPRVSGFGFSLGFRALETLSQSLTDGAPSPIREVTAEFKPTPRCADRVIQDSKRAKQTARLLLAVRYRNAMRNKTPVCMDTAAVLPIENDCSKLSLEHDPSRLQLVEKNKCQNTTYPPSTLSSNASTVERKLPLVSVLHNHSPANNTLSSTLYTSGKDLDNKQTKVLQRRGGKENKFSV